MGGNGSNSTAWVTNGPPLVRSGLVRLASLAGLDVTDDAGAATITLRGPDRQPTGRPIDVCIDRDALTVVISASPDEEAWVALRSLVTNVLEAS
jgi:hypothetical protein